MANKLAMVFGVVFLLVGILGFIPNPIVGDTGGTWFHADAVHNLVHIVSGLVFLYVSKKASSKTTLVLKVFGIIYLLVAVLGFMIGEGTILGFLEVNSADNWLHLILGLVILGAGFSGKNGNENGMISPQGMA